MPKAHERHALRVRIRNAAIRYADSLSYESGANCSENYHRDLKQLTQISKRIFNAETALMEAMGELNQVCAVELDERDARIRERHNAKMAEKLRKVEFTQEKLDQA